MPNGLANGCRNETAGDARNFGLIQGKITTTWMIRVVDKVAQITPGSDKCPFTEVCTAFGSHPSQHEALATAMNDYLTQRGSKKRVLTTSEMIFPAAALEARVGRDQRILGTRHVDSWPQSPPGLCLFSCL